MYYFAYGSNKNENQMQHRCPGAIRLGLATLPHFELITSRYSRSWKEGIYSVTPKKGAKVDGILWDINAAHLETLDVYEGFPFVYDRSITPILSTIPGAESALVYCAHFMEESMEVSEGHKVSDDEL